MKALLATVVLAVTAWPSGPSVPAQAPPKLEYDVFCTMAVEPRRAAFLAASAENRAELVRTQIERWRDAHRTSLGERQLAFLADLLASITPAAYGGGDVSDAERARQRAMVNTQRALFAAEDIQAMQPTGPCIAKVK